MGSWSIKIPAFKTLSPFTGRFPHSGLILRKRISVLSSVPTILPASKILNIVNPI